MHIVRWWLKMCCRMWWCTVSQWPVTHYYLVGHLVMTENNTTITEPLSHRWFRHIWNCSTNKQQYLDQSDLIDWKVYLCFTVFILKYFIKSQVTINYYIYFICVFCFEISVDLFYIFSAGYQIVSENSQKLIFLWSPNCGRSWLYFLLPVLTHWS